MDSDLMLTSKTVVEVNEESMCKVIILNDDTTSMDFVVLILISVFKKDFNSAMEIMMVAHMFGRAVVDVCPRKLARARRVDAMRKAREQGYKDFTVQIEEN